MTNRFRFGPRISLRRFLGAVSILCLLLGIRSWRVATEASAVERLKAAACDTDELLAGVYVRYEYENKWGYWRQRLGKRYYLWLHTVIGELILYRIESINLQGSGVTNASLCELRALSAVAAVEIRNAPNVTDACVGQLGGLANVRTIRLTDTGVTRNGVAELRRALPRCEVEWSPALPKPAIAAWIDTMHRSPTKGLLRVEMRGPTIEDKALAALPNLASLGDLSITQAPGITNDGLRHLVVCKSLQRIMLHGTSATQAGVDGLQRALPNCRIMFFPAGPLRESTPGVVEALLRFIWSEWLGFGSKAPRPFCPPSV